MKNKKKYPSGRSGGSENVWNFSKSYENSAIVPSMRKKLKKFTGINRHK